MLDNVLVAGGVGYIGSQTVKELSKKGYNIVVLDNNSDKRIVSFPRTEYIKGDIRDRKHVYEILNSYSIKTIVNFAAYIDVSESVSNPKKYYENNVTSGKKLLDAAVESGVENFVFSSSCATYGIPDKVPIDESEKQLPINPYGWTKLFFERILKDYNVAYGINYVILRYFNAAGADSENIMGEMHDPETHVVPILLQNALGLRNKFSVFGTDYETYDGSCIRDYIHVEDLADAHVKAIEYLKRGGKSDCFNLGTGKGVSVLELIRIVQDITKTELNISLENRRLGDPAVLVADNTKAIEALDWIPKKSAIENIIETAWKWHKKYDLKLHKNKPDI